MKHTIVNLDTKEIIVRDYTELEIEQYNADLTKITEDIANVPKNGPTEEEIIAKQNAKADVLAQLGITEEQARLLLS